ncbi:UDP-glycosyltransferase 73C6-like [Wolffia australiana]
MDMQGKENTSAHFVLIPLMAQGHMIPMVDTGLLLAARGVVTSVITTPLNAARFKITVEEAQASGLPLRLVQLPFPCREAGLPDGCENLDTLPSKELIINFFRAISLIQSEVEEYLSNLEFPATCIVSDMGLPWTSNTAKKLGIPRLIFHVSCCFSLLCNVLVRRSEVYDSVNSDDEPFAVPGIPHRIEVTRAQLPSNFAMKSSMKGLRDEILESEAAAQGIIVNSFDVLERGYAELYQKTMGKKVWTVGPAFYGGPRIPRNVSRGRKASVDEEKCSSWLDGKEPCSVIYVSFGSLARFSFEQLVEIGLGLESANHPFIWVVSERYKATQTEEWLGGGFEERTKDRSLIIRGWAPQVFILSHPSTGGFLTHCGWNSSLEGISAGIPMVTWPLFADHFFNEKLVLEVAQVGVGVGVKSASVWQDETPGVSVTKEEVRRAVENLMDRGEEGAARRRRVRELGEKAKIALEAGGSSYANLNNLIEEMANRSG